MSAGLGRLGLSHRDFWAMTPRELAAALRGHYGLDLRPQTPSRATLSELIAAFPDQTHTAD